MVSFMHASLLVHMPVPVSQACMLRKDMLQRQSAHTYAVHSNPHQIRLSLHHSTIWMCVSMALHFGSDPVRCLMHVHMHMQLPCMCGLIIAFSPCSTLHPSCCMICCLNSSGCGHVLQLRPFGLRVWPTWCSTPSHRRRCMPANLRMPSLPRSGA